MNGNRTNQTTSRTLPSGTNVTLVTTYRSDSMNRVVETIDPDGSTNRVAFHDWKSEIPELKC